MRCSEHWLKEDPGLFVEDIDHMLPMQKARDIEAQECIDYLMQGQSGHDMYNQKTGGFFGYFSSDVLELFHKALETKNCTKTNELLSSYPALVRTDFMDGNTGLHKAKDAKVHMYVFMWHGGGVCVGVCIVGRQCVGTCVDCVTI